MANRDDWEEASEEEASEGLLHPYYIGLRLISDRVGIDFWDIDRNRVNKYVRNESKPRSRFWFGSPCRFVRGIDLMVHVYLPNMLDEKYPELSTYLRTTSPRWGKSWREW